MEKIVKFSKRIDGFLKVLWWLLIISGALITIGFVVMLFVPDNLIQSALMSGNTFSFNIESLTIKLSEQLISAADFKKTALITLAALLPVISLGVAMIYQLRGIMNNMKNGTPFANDMSKRIKNLAFTIFISSFLPQTMSAIVTYVEFKYAQLGGILNSIPSISSVDLDFFVVDGSMILVGLIVLLLSTVFEYGRHLQNEQDTTL